MNKMNSRRGVSIDELIAQAVDDPSREHEVFSRLLSTTLYVHAPIRRTGPNLVLVQFTMPQGFLAIPVFTDAQKAEFAGRGNVHIVPIAGRLLFEATRGATFVINPNDNWCAIFPEEIDALLSGQSLPTVPEPIQVEEGMKLQAARNPNPLLIDLIDAVLSQVEDALDAWLTETASSAGPDQADLVLVVYAPPRQQLRISRSLKQALSQQPIATNRMLDVTFIETQDDHERWRRQHKDCHIYSRIWAANYTGRKS